MIGKTKEHMNRIKLGLLAVASACLLAALPAQANLVVNGGFETGAFPPWTAANAVITSIPANVFAGTYAAQLNATSSSITQTVPIVATKTYFLDFWAQTDGAGILTVTLDGALAFTKGFTGATGYAHYSSGPVTVLSGGDVTFNWADGVTPILAHVFVDAVTLVPEPTTMIAGALLLLPFGASTLRILRRNRVAVA